MTVRFIPGIGRASYSAVEDALARSLIADGKHDEVRVLHELKATLDATAVEFDPTWQRERAAIETRQEVLL